MPLDSSVAVTEVRKISDPTHPAHVWPSSAGAAATRWAAAVRAYFDGLAAPALVPGTLDLAEAALAAAFDPSAGIAGLQAGLSAFAGAVVAGIAPGLVATPPPAPPVWGSLTNTSDGTARSTQIGQALDAWARTGLAGVLPGSPSNPWS